MIQRMAINGCKWLQMAASGYSDLAAKGVPQDGSGPRTPRAGRRLRRAGPALGGWAGPVLGGVLPRIGRRPRCVAPVTVVQSKP
jgi:hypothetical protein